MVMYAKALEIGRQNDPLVSLDSENGDGILRIWNHTNSNKVAHKHCVKIRVIGKM